MTSEAEGSAEIKRLLKEGAAVGRPEGLAVTVGPFQLTLRDWKCKFALELEGKPKPPISTARRDLVRDLEQLLASTTTTTPPRVTATTPSTARGAKRLRAGKESDDASIIMPRPMSDSPEPSPPPQRPPPRLLAFSPPSCRAPSRAPFPP